MAARRRAVHLNLHGQGTFLPSPKSLLATDPRAFVQWLETNRPDPVSADQKARILQFLPREGELRPFGPSSSRKLDQSGAAASRCRAATRYTEIKLVDVPQVRIERIIWRFQRLR